MLMFYCYVSLPECRGVYLSESYHGKKKSCDLAKPTQLPYVSSIDLTRIEVNQSVQWFSDFFLTAPCCPYPNLQGYEYWHWISQELSIKKISNNLYIHTRVNIPEVFHIAPTEWWLEDLPTFNFEGVNHGFLTKKRLSYPAITRINDQILYHADI